MKYWWLFFGMGCFGLFLFAGCCLSWAEAFRADKTIGFSGSDIYLPWAVGVTVSSFWMALVGFYACWEQWRDAFRDTNQEARDYIVYAGTLLFLLLTLATYGTWQFFLVETEYHCMDARPVSDGLMGYVMKMPNNPDRKWAATEMLFDGNTCGTQVFETREMAENYLELGFEHEYPQAIIENAS